MENNTTNEGMVNNSNQPSQTEKLNGMINKKITNLTEQLGKIGNEISELKQIEVTDEITKIVVGSTEFNIEDFMSEPDIQKYRNWLEVKKEFEEKSEDEVDELVSSENEKSWERNFQDYITSNYYYDDIDNIDDIKNFSDFVYDYITDPDEYQIDRFKDDFLNDKDDKETLQEYLESRLVKS